MLCTQVLEEGVQIESIVDGATIIPQSPTAASQASHSTQCP